jgi:hypothetical protein
MARTWLSIQVELVEGRGETFWPRPGRVMVAARSHTFAALAVAIDDAFARWDRSHLHQFWGPDGQRATTRTPWDDFDEDDEAVDDKLLKLGSLKPGDQFVYEFDFGDSWLHLCTVHDQRVNPIEVLGIVPPKPLPSWGWGQIPDQYGRRWSDDDGQGRPPSDPHSRDLPAIGPWQRRLR